MMDRSVPHRAANPGLAEPARGCNNNSSPLHAVGLAAIAQLARQEPSPARAERQHFPGVLPTDVVVQLPDPAHYRCSSPSLIPTCPSRCKTHFSLTIELRRRFERVSRCFPQS